MTSLLIAALLAQTAVENRLSPDAPLYNLEIVSAGSPAPAAGVWLSSPSFIALAERVERCEVERDELQKMPAEKTGIAAAVIMAFFGGAVLGAAISAGIFLKH